MANSPKPPRIVPSTPNITASGAIGLGGAGEAPAWADPMIVMSAPAGIVMVTPQSASLNAGVTTSVAAQDINLVAGANAGHIVKYGISMFTYGKASNPKKPNQETGIMLHAASGKVSSQSQSDKTMVTADKAITIASTTDAVTIQAPKHVLLTAQGAYIKMSGGNIEVHAPGKVDIKASMKSWTGPVNVPADSLDFDFKDLKIKSDLNVTYEDAAGAPLKGEPLKFVFHGGDEKQVSLGEDGKAKLVDVPRGPITGKQPKRKA